MGRYRTCVGCAFEGVACGERDKLRDAIAGLSVTSVKWKCEWRRPKFAPGDPVFVSIVTHWGRDDDGVDHAELATFPGVYIDQAKAPSKAIVFIAPGTPSVQGETAFTPVRDGNGFCRLSQSYLTRREGVPDHVCDVCSNPVTLLGHADHCRHWPGPVLPGDDRAVVIIDADFDIGAFA
jgi:hypothetical protein